MSDEASQRHFRSSRNDFMKFTKDLSSQITNANFDEETYESELQEFED